MMSTSSKFSATLVKIAILNANRARLCLMATELDRVHARKGVHVDAKGDNITYAAGGGSLPDRPAGAQPA